MRRKLTRRLKAFLHERATQVVEPRPEPLGIPYEAFRAFLIRQGINLDEWDEELRRGPGGGSKTH